LINFVNSYDQLETPEEMSRSEEVLELTGGILARQQEQEHRMSQGSTLAILTLLLLFLLLSCHIFFLMN
jgi:hypothetical protein